MTRHIMPISGKDSLATWLVQRQRAPLLPYEPMFNPTGAETPEVDAWLAKVEAYMGVPITRVGSDLGEIIDDIGMLPSMHARFCTRKSKIEPMEDWIGKADAHIYYGIRADEKRGGYSNVRKPNITAIYPLVEEGIDLGGAWEICRNVGLLPPAFFWQAIYDETARLLGAYADVLETLDPVKHQRLFAWRSRPNCFYCLAGETEVVTIDGIRPIRELAGKDVEILVPKFNSGTLSEVGKFQKVPVRSFGVQRLMRITMKRGRSKKVVHATPEHRWFVVGNGARRANDPVITTSNLKPGDRLKNLNRCPVGQERGQALKIAAMQGFAFGDGARAQGDRPATLDLFEGKSALFPLFAACCDYKAEETAKGTKYWHFYGLPRSWKQLPDLHESRSFLMGWLSGWFAADGCVDTNGICVLHSATPANLEFARSVCALLGIQCSPVRTFDREGFGGVTKLSEIKINRHHLTDDFFWHAHHKTNIASALDKPIRQAHWVVESVEETDRVEEVFCATVEGVGAFGLSDGLMTGNCFFQRAYEWVGLFEHHPDLFWRAVEMEETIGAEGYTWRNKQPLRTLLARSDAIKRRRAMQIVKHLLPQQQWLFEDEEGDVPDLLQVVSCGLFCGK